MRNAPLLDPFGRSRLPAGYTREHRIQLVDEVARALLAGELPSIEARLFVAGSMTSWLQVGGNLTRDFLRVDAPRSSHNTASRLWRETCSSRGATNAEDAGTIDADSESESDP